MSDIKWNKVSGDMENNRNWNGKDSGLKQGDQIEGLYIGKREDVGPNKSTIYTIETDTEKVDVWGSTVLDRKMSEVGQGKLVRITFLGMKKSEKRSGEYKDYDVEWAAPEGGAASPDW